MEIRVLLADDHPVVRQGLHRMLETEPDFEVVGEAGDGLETVALVEQLHPDILIVDLMMPGMNGLEVTRRAVLHQPDLRVIVLSMHQDDAYILQALRRGAMGYVLKDSSPIDLVEAIREVYRGNRYLSKKLTGRLSSRLADTGEQGDPYELLTSREKEVLQLILKGQTSVEIARNLSISARTVEVHRANIMHKLNISSQIGLIRFAIKRGILPVDHD